MQFACQLKAAPLRDRQTIIHIQIHPCSLNYLTYWIYYAIYLILPIRSYKRDGGAFVDRVKFIREHWSDKGMVTVNFPSLSVTPLTIFVSVSGRSRLKYTEILRISRTSMINLTWRKSASVNLKSKICNPLLPCLFQLHALANTVPLWTCNWRGIWLVSRRVKEGLRG